MHVMMFSFAMIIGVCLRRNMLYVVMLTLLLLLLLSLLSLTLLLLGNLWER